MKFGSFVKELRAQNRIGLREFCLKNNLDPSNWSKIERGILPPPKNREIILDMARSFALKENSNEWNDLFDLAALDAGMIPHDIINNQNLIGKLPIFFRTLRGQKPTDDEIEELIKVIKEN